MKSLTRLVAVILGLCFASTSFAQKKTTVNGDIVELTSYLKENIKPSGPAAKEIAMENLRKGGTLAIVQSKTRKVYLLSSAPGDTTFTATVAPYFGLMAYIKGTLYSRGGVNMIVVEDIGKYLGK